MKQLFVNVHSIHNRVFTKDLGDKPITQLNFDDSGKIVALKCLWIRNETHWINDDLFLTVDNNGKFVNVHGNLIATIKS